VLESALACGVSANGVNDCAERIKKKDASAVDICDDDGAIIQTDSPDRVMKEGALVMGAA
jgi:hypothetical protein